MSKPKWLRELEAERVERGVCRHCGGGVPCWSLYGDARVGVRHSDRSYDAMLKREREAKR